MIPPRSPYGLIQEDLWPDEWKILLSCVMLNCTTRKQLDKVLPSFFKLWPTPQKLLESTPEDIVPVIKTLGFANRRSNTLWRMTQKYLDGNWSRASELPGIGEYASAAHDIFCRGLLPPFAPKDHALVKYYNWRKRHEERKETSSV